jgi:hypothetical protein
MPYSGFQVTFFTLPRLTGCNVACEAVFEAEATYSLILLPAVQDQDLCISMRKGL